MSKKNSVLSTFIHWSLHVLIFLIPLSFISQGIFTVLLSNHLLVVGLIILLLLAVIIQAMKQGKLQIDFSLFSKAVIFLLVVTGISLLFSSSITQSFWSFSPGSFFNLLLYGLGFLLVVNLINKNVHQQISRFIDTFLWGSGVLSLLFLLKVGAMKGWLWSGFQSIGFSQINGEHLALFFGGALVVAVAQILHRLSQGRLRFLSKILFTVLSVLLFVSLLAINYGLAWLLIFIGVAVALFSFTYLIDNFSVQVKKIIAPLLLLAIVGTLFTVSSLGAYQKRLVNIGPTLGATATFHISLSTVKDSVRQAFVGSGPSTFAQQHDRHHPLSLNKSMAWNRRFSQGFSWWLTSLAIYGFLGALALLWLAFLFFRSLISELRSEKSPPLALVAGGTYFILGWFIHPGNWVLLFCSFIFLGGWTLLHRRRKEFKFTQSPQRAFFTLLSLLVLMIVVGAGSYFVGRNYQSLFLYQQGLQQVNAKLSEEDPPTLGEGVKKIEKALNIHPREYYYQQLAQIYQRQLRQTFQTEEKPSQTQQYVSKIQDYLKGAQRLNPQNSNNFLQEGYFYSSLFGAQGAFQRAISAYQKAQDLAPHNPQIPYLQGQLYYQQAQQSDQEEKGLSWYQTAEDQFTQALTLKDNYAAAYFLRAKTREKLGQNQKAIEDYRLYQQLRGPVPVEDIINNLQSGTQ